LNDLLLMKFGGTSLGSAERIRVAARLAREQHARRPVAIVVSAMAKVTDLLLDSMRKAELGDQAALQANLQKLQDRHLETCRELLPKAPQENLLAGIRNLIAEFQRIAGGILMLGVRPLRSVDEAVVTGEKLSALLLAACLDSEGVPSAVVNGSDVIVTDAFFGNATPLMDPTCAKAREKLRPLLE
jgi:aspartate kinase